jgi:tRNA A37 N6-isopentenylltransferase MiaA
MDIGTAKPTRDERANVPHWGLDLVEPGGRFTVADFKAYAEQKIAEIRERGNVPFLVGGTGLYIDAIVFDFAFAAIKKDGANYSALGAILGCIGLSQRSSAEKSTVNNDRALLSQGDHCPGFIR